MNEYRTIMTVLTGFCVLGAACGIWPAVEHIASIAFAVLIGIGGLVGAVAITRAVVDEIRLRREFAEAATPVRSPGSAPVGERR